MPDTRRLSKTLAYYLRHAPHELGLQLAPGGWVEVSQLLAALHRRGHRCSQSDLEEVVALSDKQRFALQDGKIRANQGHSTPVDLQLKPETPPDVLYHGTTRRSLPSILREGLNKGRRHHVHLSLNIDTARQVGQRHGPVVLLRIDAAAMAERGLLFYRSQNNVWLTDRVAAEFISQL